MTMRSAAIAAFLLFPIAGAAQTSETARAQERTRALQQEADRLAATSRTLLGDLRQLEIERQMSQATLAAADARLVAISSALTAARGRLAALDARRHDAAPALAAELVEIYKRGRPRHARLLLAHAADGRALGRLIRGALALASAEQTRLDAHRRLLHAEREAIATLEQQRVDAATSREAQLTARATLEQTLAERHRLIDAIDRDRDVAARYLGELQSAEAALDTTLAELYASTPRPVVPIAPFKGDLEWPVSGIVHSRFGAAAAASPGQTPRAIVRNGIELGATAGTPVTAVHGGRVSYAAPFLGLGTLVVIEHGDQVQTLYGYLEQIRVTAGTLVDRGEQLGQVGLVPGPSPGGATAGTAGTAALYFELRVDGRPVDPLQWLRSSP